MTGRLRDLRFVDLIIGEAYADMKAEPGTGAARVALASEYDQEIQEVRGLCSRAFEKHGDPEFALKHDDVLYRVTVMTDLAVADVFFLRRMSAEIRPIEKIPLPQAVRDLVLAPATKGLIVVAGDMAAGKTSTAASMLSALLKMHGGTALAVEDPPETILDGIHGEGRCIQVPASRKHGSYREQLRRTLRTGVGTLLIGEIRDEDTAKEAVRQSINGLRVITTLHAKDPVEAIKRLVDLASQGADGAQPAALLASGLTAVIHQEIQRISTPLGGANVRLQFRCLVVPGPTENAIRTKIREENFDHLKHELDAQNKGQIWQ